MRKTLMKDYVASTRIWYLCIIYIVSLLCTKGLAIEVCMWEVAGVGGVI